MGRDHTRFGNSWCGEFSTPRKINDEQRLVEARRAYHANGDDLGIFFIDLRDTTAPLEVDVVESFCRGTNLEYVKKGKGSAGGLRTVWLDDRNSFPDLEGSGDTREYENPLTATGLLRALEQQRFNHEKLHDAARRLIYVSDLSPDCIHALAATASSLHARALRSAIYRHLVFRPSIAVKIPSTGCLTFQLELHLPFFILRKSTPPDKTDGTVKTKPDRGWTDLSFLELDTPDSKIQPSEPNEVWSLQEAQISYVVTGTDNWRWTGYGFVDAEVDGLLADASEDDMCFDQIAGGGEMEAGLPIWRPRDYWVRVFEVRIERITRQYEHLIHNFSHAFDQYMKIHPFTLSPRPATSQDQTAEMKAAFDWTLQMMGLLRKPHNVLLATVEAWRAFNSEDGNVGYFFDGPDADADATAQEIEARASRYRSMQNIKASFGELSEFQGNIVELSEKCSDYKKALELSLILGQKEVADKIEFTNVFTLNFLCPLGLAATIFSMQLTVIPFKPTPKSFVITFFVMIVIVFVAQVFGTRAVPSLRKSITRWTKQGEREEDHRGMAGAELKKEDKPVKGVGQERTLTDEESVTPEISRVKAKTWMSWMTGTTIA